MGHSARGLDVSSALREGTACCEICSGASELSADLVVVGSQGRRGLRRAVLGSVAERVVRTSPSPVLTVHLPNRHRQILSNLAALGLSALIIATALCPIFGIDLVLLFVIGGAMVASNTAANSILQSSIDGRIRGRVSSMYILALRGGAPLGSLATGTVTSHWGVRTAFLVNGALALVCHAALIRRARRRARARVVLNPGQSERG